MKFNTTLNHSECSRITHLEPQAFSSNDLLSDADQQILQQVIIETENHVKSLDEDISRLQEVIGHIQKRRTKSLARIARLRIGIAPHRKVPPEIMAKIFVECAAIDGPTLHLPPRYPHSIWNMIQVCSKWRQIAFAEPLLWNQVSISTDTKIDTLNHLIHDIFSNRGGQGAINYHPPYVHSLGEWEDVANYLFAYPSRLQKITLKFADFIPPSFNTPSTLFDNLESLVIHFKSSRRIFENMQIKAFSSARGLKQVSIRSDETNIKLFSSWATCILLPWPQLTHITINGIPTSVLTRMLSCCVHLVCCKIGPQSNLLGEEPYQSPIRLQHIQSILFTSYSDYSAVQTVMNLLAVPALKSLAFALPGWEQWPQASVLKLIQRSRCRLETFETPEDALVGDQILSLMRAMPHLTDLSACHKEPISEATLETIISENLCPNLRILKGWQIPSIHSFIRFLQSRGAGPREGICNVSATVSSHMFDLEKGYYESILPGFKITGKAIVIEPYIPY